MEGFAWAENNLGISGPHELPARGVNVYFAPNIAAGKTVNLADGRVISFAEDEDRPRSGYYADFESLARYCAANELACNETNGLVSVLPAGTTAAGSPLAQRRR